MQREAEDGPSFSSFDSELTNPEMLEGYVKESLSELEGRLEMVLDNISDDLAGEVSRERQHLMLMQEQVDKQGQSLQKEFGEMHKALEQEKTQRALVQQRAREESQLLGDNLRSISKELQELTNLVQKMRTPWTTRMLNDICGVFKQCYVTGTANGPGAYMSLPETDK